MNKLQIIEEIFGDKYCPKVKHHVGFDIYSAKLRHNNRLYFVSTFDLKKILSKAKKFNARIGIDFYNLQFDIYFDN